MRRVRKYGYLTIAIASLATLTAARSSHNIFERASTCGDPSYTQCAEAGLPSSFCCPASSVCIPLAANTTVLCCPSGADCSAILPITCDITKQNSTLDPSTTIQTTALTSTLLKCGSACCPFGYSCNANGDCIMQANQQSLSPVKGSSSSSSSQTSSPTTSSTAPSTTQKPSCGSASAVPVTNSTSPLTASCDKFPITAVLVGLFPGIIAGAVLTLATICALGSCRQKPIYRKSGSSFGNISEPQSRNGDEMRNDFLRKQQPQTPSTMSAATPTPARRSRSTGMRSLFRKTSGSYELPAQDPHPVPPVPLNVQSRPMVAGQESGRPVTPKLQREPSYGDINIFADGETASALRERQRLGNAAAGGGGIGGPTDPRLSHQTTFTDMMERSGLAGLQKGQPYVYRGNSAVYSPSPPRQESPKRTADI